VIILLTSEQLRLLKEVARKSFPVEACAILFGKIVGEEAVVTKIVVAPNILQSSVRFKIDPETVVSAFEQADREGLQFIGLFHSHPAPANPTTTDLQNMKLWPYAIWLILSTTNDGIAAFQITNGKIQKVALKIDLQDANE
jgi:proteasome lid subunit RPN8/RPN11